MSFPWRGRRPTPREAPLGYKRDFLRQIEIFKDLTQADVAELDAATRMTTARKGRVIYHQEDSAEGLFLLKAGRVRLFVRPGEREFSVWAHNGSSKVGTARRP